MTDLRQSLPVPRDSFIAFWPCVLTIHNWWLGAFDRDRCDGAWGWPVRAHGLSAYSHAGCDERRWLHVQKPISLFGPVGVCCFSFLPVCYSFSFLFWFIFIASLVGESYELCPSTGRWVTPAVAKNRNNWISGSFALPCPFILCRVCWKNPQGVLATQSASRNFLRAALRKSCLVPSWYCRQYE